MRHASAATILILLAGCITPVPPDAPTEPPTPGFTLDKFPIELNHDHNNAALHKASRDLERVAFVKTGLGNIPNAPVFNLGLAKNTLVASLGSIAPAGALGPPMALLVADFTDVR